LCSTSIPLSIDAGGSMCRCQPGCIKWGTISTGSTRSNTALHTLKCRRTAFSLPIRQARRLHHHLHPGCHHLHDRKCQDLRF
jgi:hypothetical protein